MKIQPYLFFEGRTEEALEFYKSAVGAEVEMLMRYKDSPEPAMVPPGNGEKVMHSAFSIGETKILASDGNCSGKASLDGFSLAIYAADQAEAEKLFAALSAGGQVRMPLSRTFFSPSFGMLADKFGVGWMVMVEPKA